MYQQRLRVSHGRGRKHKKPILIGLGVAIALIAFLSALGMIVISDNSTECKKIELDGGLFGCAINEKYAYDRIIMVVGNTANVPAPTLTKLTKRYITNSLVKNEDLELEVFSVNPLREQIRINDDADATELDEGIGSMVSTTNARLQSIEKSLNVAPKGDGAVYLESLTKAINSAVSERDDENEKVLIIVTGSGLSDSGALNFASRDNLLHRDVDEIINRLVETGKIQEGQAKGEKNIKIVWSGVGSTVTPQNSLSDAEIAQLKDIYSGVVQRIFSTSKKDYIEFSDYTSTDSKSVETNHTVKVTETEKESSLWGESGQKRYDEGSSISFRPETSDFKDDLAARKELDVLSKEIAGSPNYKVSIVGYAAFPMSSTGGCDKGADVSELTTQRAMRIKDELVERGVSQDIITVSSGGHGPNDECPAGQYDEAIAQTNRIITLNAVKQ